MKLKLIVRGNMMYARVLPIYVYSCVYQCKIVKNNWNKLTGCLAGFFPLISLAGFYLLFVL